MYGKGGIDQVSCQTMQNVAQKLKRILSPARKLYFEWIFLDHYAIMKLLYSILLPAHKVNWNPYMKKTLVARQQFILKSGGPPHVPVNFFHFSYLGWKKILYDVPVCVYLDV